LIIIPKLPTDTTNPELVPIAMILETRLDCLALYLRVIRYFAQQGFYGEALRWEDSDESPIYIAKRAEDTEGKQEANILPAVLIGIGGYVTGEKFLGKSRVATSLKGETSLSDMDTSLSLLIQGRSELEVYNLADKTALFLDSVKGDILGSAINLDHMSGISVGQVRKLVPKSGNPYVWECELRISISVNRLYMTARYPGKSPDPRVNSGKFAGESGDQHKEDTTSKRPMLSFASFTIEAGVAPSDYEFVVSEQHIFDDQGVKSAEAYAASRAAYSISMDPNGNFGNVPIGAPSASRDLVIEVESLGEATFDIVLPDEFRISSPGADILFSDLTGIPMKKES